MAREVPNPADGSAGQVPKVQTDGTYDLAADDSGGSGSGDTILIAPGDDWVPTVENANPGDIIWFRAGEHKDTTNTDSDPGPIEITTNNIALHVAPGATVMARDGLGEEEPFFQVLADNVTFQGGGTLDGNQVNSDGLAANPPDSHGWEHIIDCNRGGIGVPVHVSNLRVLNLTLQNAGGGDGLYLNDVDGVIVDNVHIDNAYRNGISVADADDVIISNCLVENTSGVSPESGIAFEPYTTGQSLDRIVLANVHTRNHVNHGVYVNNMAATRSFGSDIVNISFKNVYALNNGWRGFSLHGTDGAEALHLDTCTANYNSEAGFYLAGGGRMSLTNCHARDNGAAADDNHCVGVVAELDDFHNSTPADVTVRKFIANDFSGYQKYPGSALNGSTLRAVDVRSSGHTSADNFRSNGTGSVIEHHLIDAADGSSPVTLNGGSATQL